MLGTSTENSCYAAHGLFLDTLYDDSKKARRANALRAFLTSLLEWTRYGRLQNNAVPLLHYAGRIEAFSLA